MFKPEAPAGPGDRPRFVPIAASLLLAAILFAPLDAGAAQNNGGSGGTTIGDLEGQGYRCIAQDPRTGNLWCVRGHDEPGYVCTPEGQCHPVDPSPRPPWRLNPGGGLFGPVLPGGRLLVQ